MYSKLRTFWKKRWAFWRKYSRSYWLHRKWFLKCLKGPTSGHDSVNNVLAGAKHCSSHHGAGTTKCFLEYGKNIVKKNKSLSDLKSWNSLLTQWLPSTSIPVAICRISSNNFKRSYLRNEKLFLDFLLHFWNIHQVLNTLIKKMGLLA